MGAFPGASNIPPLVGPAHAVHCEKKSSIRPSVDHGLMAGVVRLSPPSAALSPITALICRGVSSAGMIGKLSHSYPIVRPN